MSAWQVDDERVDYTVEVRCDHTGDGEPIGEESPRLVSLVAHRVNTHGAIGFAEWVELRPTSDPSWEPSVQTYYGEAMRLGTFGPGTKNLAPDDYVPGMTEDRRWRFKCADCTDTLPVRHTKLLPLLTALRSAGVPHVTIRAVRSTLFP